MQEIKKSVVKMLNNHQLLRQNQSQSQDQSLGGIHIFSCAEIIIVTNIGQLIMKDVTNVLPFQTLVHCQQGSYPQSMKFCASYLQKEMNVESHSKG